MKRIVYISLLLLLQHLATAQGFRARCYSASGLNHSTKDIFEISPGNYFGIGASVDTKFKLSVTGLNANGQVLWLKTYGTASRQFGNSPFTVRTAAKVGNHIYYAGSVFENSVYSGVLIKFDFNGDTLWQKYYKDPAADLVLQKVSPSVDGGFLLTGYFVDNVNNIEPCVVIKTDANGNELWRRKLNKAAPNVSDGKAVLQDAATKKIVIGGYQHIGSQSNWDSRDNLIILDSLGNIEAWNYFNTGQCHDLIQTSDQKIVAVGQIEYNSGSPLFTSYALKFDVNNPSTPIWRINGFGPLTDVNFFNAIVELSNGNLLIGGGIDSLQAINNRGNILSRFVWVSPTGQILKTKYYDYAPNTSADNAQGVICLSKTSDGGWITSLRCLNNTNNPMFYVKYDANGCDSTTAYCATVGIEKRGVKSAAIRLWPNPANDFVEISGDESFAISITDVAGRIVATDNASFYHKLDINKLETGAYFITIIYRAGVSETRKLIISH